LIDDEGVARLSANGCGQTAAIPDTSTVDHGQSVGDVDNDRYSAPELHQLDGRSVDEIPVTKESDVYEMGMVIYEASSHRPVLSGVRFKSHINPLGLDNGQTVLWLRRYRCHVKGTGR